MSSTWNDIIRPTKTGHVVTLDDGSEWLVKYEDSGLSADTDMSLGYNAVSSNGGYLRGLVADGYGRRIRKSYEER